MNNKTIGERIRAARKAKGLSQEQLGEKLDISFQAVSSWETGKFIPDSEHLPALAWNHWQRRWISPWIRFLRRRTGPGN